MELDAFTKGYIDCALWASLDDNDEPLDNYYGVDDLAEETFQGYKENRRLYRENCTYPQKWTRGREPNPEYVTV